MPEFALARNSRYLAKNSEQEPEGARRTELQYGLSEKDLAQSSGGDDHY
jgi:hypothetical protein